MRTSWILAAACALSTPLAAQTIGLAKLAEIARERAARLRPAMLEALEPFAKDLELGYRGRNQSYLDAKFDEIVGLGAGVSTILLEYLTPANATPESMNRSDNAARILARLDPGDFTDTLIDLASSSSESARRNALTLLGHAGNRQAEAALIDRLANLADPERRLAVDGLARMASTRGVEAAAPYMASPDHVLRQRVLVYATLADRDGVAVDAIRSAFSSEPNAQLLSSYVSYFERHVEADAAVAEALVPLTAGTQLSYAEQRRLMQALGKIAPAGHAPTIAALETVIEATDNAGPLEIAAALSLQKIGEKGGVKTVDRRLDQAIKRQRNDSDAYANRANWFCELGEWRNAIRDYEAAIKHSKSGSRKSMFHLMIARCEAHRGKWTRVRSALRDSGASRRAIEREAAGDPEFAAALEKDAVRRFLESLD